MPSPKSGNAPSAVPPADPKQASEADRAIPGESETGNPGEEKPHRPPGSQQEREEKKHWIEIELFHKKTGLPVVGEPYRVVLPDGATVAEGTLDEKGFARIDYLDPGQCTVNFPKRDKSAWNRKG